MKECMYSYQYHRRRAIMRPNRIAQRIVTLIMGIAVAYSVFSIVQLIIG